ncbi:FAD/NAD(P)-binding domain-containing protein [Ophiobolus disseminans]|uniref:FAD/NAD(P)-binding domain-containing protein n=1 Tax=Ophiobolus disseminans TaxID=1469910 RepID=A0A6A7ADN3_9PLEO|nr:FAD/NAD(P)-binding domain-containing protein [Ophiobolus disseminans]
MPPLKIAIIGAGPVSLTLANIFQNNDISFTIYEAADNFRTSGGTLDLHPESGQLALKEAGLWDAFVKHSRPEADCAKIVNFEGEVLWDENLCKKNDVSEEEKFAGRPEIDRKVLLEILYKNLRSDAITFGKRLDCVVSSSIYDTKYDLHFADSSREAGFDLVVGADGAWSKVRMLLSDIKPQYSGISMVEVNCSDIHANLWLLEFVGAGSMFSFGEARAVFAQRQGDGGLRVYAALRVPGDFVETCGIDWEDKDVAREELVERYFHDIHDDLKRVTLDCKDELMPRALWELPVGFTWAHRSGVTLIGDAAHLMTPFAGVGVNVGMTDALVLGREIVAAVRGAKELDDAIKEYEKEMFPRAEENAKETAEGKECHFSKDGAKIVADMMREHHVPG